MRELTSHDITMWRAYASLEPFGAVRDDRRIGTLAALYYNANRERGTPTHDWGDFFPNVESLPTLEEEEAHRRSRTPEQQAANFIAAARAWNERLGVRS